MSALSQDRPSVEDRSRRGATQTEVLHDVTLAVEQRRIRLDHRPFGLRQVHAAQHRGGPAAAHHRRRAAREPRGERARARTARSCSRTTRCCRGSRSTTTSRLAVNKVFGGTKSRAERHDWVDAQSRSRADGARQGQAAGGDLRRHEAARRPRARARDGAEGAAARRAVRRARRADARAPAGLA